MEKKRFWEYVKYNIKDTEVIISGPPRESLGKIMPKDLNVDAVISFTEDYIPCYWEKALYQWSPWDESSNIPNEVLLSGLLTLHHWIDTLKLKRIVVHCHGGTHRAPSIFGLYVLGFHTSIFKKVVNSADTYNGKAIYNWQDYPKKKFTTSIEILVKTKLERHPNLKQKIRAIVSGGANRLDQLNNIIVNEENLSLEDREELLESRLKDNLLNEASRHLTDYTLVNKHLTHPKFKVDTFVLIESDKFFPENFVFNFRKDWSKIIITHDNYILIESYVDKLILLHKGKNFSIYTIKQV